MADPEPRTLSTDRPSKRTQAPASYNRSPPSATGWTARVNDAYRISPAAFWSGMTFRQRSRTHDIAGAVPFCPVRQKSRCTNVASIAKVHRSFTRPAVPSALLALVVPC
eukprot:6176497-Pleurochrysis_carterae.AAC.1